MLPKTLIHGYNNLNRSNLFTLLVISSFVISLFIFYNLRLRFKHINRLQTGKKRIIKYVPFISILLVILLFVLWLSRTDTFLEKSIWQADFFVAFIFSLILFIITFSWWIARTKVQDEDGNTFKIIKVRRKPTQWLVNGLFKLNLVLLVSMALTPYYVLCVSKAQWTKGYNGEFGLFAILSLVIFLVLALVCALCLGDHFIAPLVPCVVLWGACISYFDGTFAAWHGITTNGTSLAMAFLAIKGWSFLKKYDNFTSAPGSISILIWTIFLIFVVLGFWFYVWKLYDYNLFGTDYTDFKDKSWF